jgi:hypothetical protein
LIYDDYYKYKDEEWGGKIGISTLSILQNYHQCDTMEEDYTKIYKRVLRWWPKTNCLRWQPRFDDLPNLQTFDSKNLHNCFANQMNQEVGDNLSPPLILGLPIICIYYEQLRAPLMTFSLQILSWSTTIKHTLHLSLRVHT